MRRKDVATTFWDAADIIQKYQKQGWTPRYERAPEGYKDYPFNFKLIITFFKGEV